MQLSAEYLAGLFDGEGTISIRRTIKNTYDSYTLVCSLSNTHSPIIELLKKQFNGCVGYYRYKETHKPCGNWSVTGEKAYNIIMTIAPYVIIKKAAIDIALAFWKHKLPYHATNRAKPEGFIQQCRLFYESILRANSKGTGGKYTPKDIPLSNDTTRDKVLQALRTRMIIAGPLRHGTSGYKGVSRYKKGRWQAKIGFNNKQIHLGHFDSRIDAAKAYDAAALQYYGESAYRNFHNNSII